MIEPAVTTMNNNSIVRFQDQKPHFEAPSSSALPRRYLTNGTHRLVLDHLARHKHLREDGSHYSLLASPDQLLQQGLGLAHFVKFSRQLIIFCTLATLLQVAPIVLNLQGKQMEGYIGMPAALVGKTTLGNNNYSTSQAGAYIVLFSQMAVWVVLEVLLLLLRRYLGTEQQSQPGAQDFTVIAWFEQQQYFDQAALMKCFQRMAEGARCRVMPAYDYQGDLLTVKLIQQLELDILRSQNATPVDEGKVQSLRLEKGLLQERLGFRAQSLTVLFVFVTYNLRSAKDLVVMKCREQGLTMEVWDRLRRWVGCCREKADKPFTYLQSEIYIQGQDVPPPDQILWQNLDTTPASRMVRGLVVLVLLMATLSLSTLFSGLLAVYSKSSEVQCSAVTPSYSQVLLDPSNTSTAFCFCLSYFQIVKEQNLTVCAAYLPSIAIGLATQAGMALVTALMNYVLLAVVAQTTKFMRLSRSQSCLVYRTHLAWLTTFLNSAVLPVLLTARVSGVALNTGLLFVLQLVSLNVFNVPFTDDFNPAWYLQHSVFFCVLLLCDLLGPLLRLGWVAFQHSGLDQEVKLMEGLATQLEMNTKALPYQFSPELELGQVLGLLTTVLVLGPGIPLLYPLLLLNLAVRYPISMCLLLEYSRKIEEITSAYLVRVCALGSLAVPLAVLSSAWIFTGGISRSSLSALNWFVVSSNNYLFRGFMISLLPLVFIASLIVVLALLWRQEGGSAAVCEEWPEGGREYEMGRREEYRDAAGYIRRRLKQLGE